MRYVPSLCLREGMTLGKDIIGTCGQTLLREGVVLNKSYVNTIVNMGFAGVYINDDLSNDIEVISIVSDDLRQKTITGVRDLFLSIDINEKNAAEKMIQVKQRVNEILEEVLENGHLVINMMDLKFFDDYTYQHSVNVAILSMVFGASLNLKKDKLYQLGLGALLHDIGKVFIDKNILNKPGRLTEEEFKIIKQHSMLGYEYLRNQFDFPIVSYMATLDHHEKIDGTGYPRGKEGKNISLFGKIISIVDVYDALTSKRPYRVAMQPSEAIEYLMAGAGTSFDYELVTKFIKKVAAYPVGNCVTLSNGYKAIVINNFEDANLRPEVRVFEQNGEPIEPFEINLRDDRRYLNTIIESIVNE